MHTQQHRAGTFVEFGGRDGVAESNTYMFEKIGWGGAMLEVMPEEFAQLQRNRPGTFLKLNKAVCKDRNNIIFAVSDPGHHGPLSEWSWKEAKDPKSTMTVECVTLNDVLDEARLTHVDFMTVDTEGSELSLLSTFDFSRALVDVLLIEVGGAKDAYEDNTPNGKAILDLILSHGYRRVVGMLSPQAETFNFLFVRAAIEHRYSL
jgi:FkbM family methyltransferase